MRRLLALALILAPSCVRVVPAPPDYTWAMWRGDPVWQCDDETCRTTGIDQDGNFVVVEKPNLLGAR